jgi:hypothetical protein
MDEVTLYRVALSCRGATSKRWRRCWAKTQPEEALHLRAALAAPTSATLLLDGDNNMAEVQDLLGHRHITTTQIHDRRRRARRRARATSWCLKAHRRPDGQSQPLGYASGLSPAQQRFEHLIGIATCRPFADHVSMLTLAQTAFGEVWPDYSPQVGLGPLIRVPNSERTAQK